MNTKNCTTCMQDKPFSEFYKDNRGKFGLVAKCKPCEVKRTNNRDRAKLNEWRRNHYWKVRERELERKRIFYTVKYGTALMTQKQRERRKIQPKQYKARYIVNNAVRSGLVSKRACEVCGEWKTQAHHPDHSKPLEINWLCKRHHAEIERLETILNDSRLMFLHALI